MLHFAGEVEQAVARDDGNHEHLERGARRIFSTRCNQGPLHDFVLEVCPFSAFMLSHFAITQTSAYHMVQACLPHGAQRNLVLYFSKGFSL